MQITTRNETVQVSLHQKYLVSIDCHISCVAIQVFLNPIII